MNSLEVNTEEITFHYQPKGHLQTTLTITNRHEAHAYFKVSPPPPSSKSPGPNTTSSSPTRASSTPSQKPPSPSLSTTR